MQDNKPSIGMKRIGIMTFHGSQNYGGVLQAYALQTFINGNAGHQAVIVDFRIQKDTIFNLNKGWKDLILRMIKILHYSSLKRKAQRFVRFRTEHMQLTRRYRSREELIKWPPEFDVYISGSDQVFHPSWPFVDVFYLDYPTLPGSKKVAYAPSFGLNYIPEEMKERIAGLLNRFDFLSAREKGGSDIIRELTGRKAITVLDPVLLVGRDQWRMIASRVGKLPKKYILCYALVGNIPQMKIASQLKIMTGLPIVLLTHSLYPPTSADLVIRDAGPREFLWLFDHANYIVTDSFHGTAFAVLFEKVFFSYIASPQKSERIYSLLNNLDLEKRVISMENRIRREHLTIDFDALREKLCRTITISTNYLIAALGMEKEREEKSS